MIPVFVLIDEDEAVADEQREEDAGPVTLEEAKEYLNEALYPSWDTEDYGNPIGVESVNQHVSEMIELPPEEVKRLFGVRAKRTRKKKSG